MKVSVYMNLRRKCFSIRACEGPANGRVIAHADRVSLGGVAFHVGKYGQAAVRRTGHKKVHAFVTGDLIGWDGPNAYAYGKGQDVLKDNLCGDWGDDAQTIADMAQTAGRRFTYNPYQHDGFTALDTGAVIARAPWATLSTTTGHRALHPENA